MFILVPFNIWFEALKVNYNRQSYHLLLVVFTLFTSFIAIVIIQFLSLYYILDFDLSESF